MTLCNYQTPSATKKPLYLTPGRSRVSFANRKTPCEDRSTGCARRGVASVESATWWVATSGEVAGSANGRIHGLPIVYMYLHENPLKTHTKSTTDHSWIGKYTNRGNPHGNPTSMGYFTDQFLKKMLAPFFSLFWIIPPNPSKMTYCWCDATELMDSSFCQPVDIVK